MKQNPNVPSILSILEEEFKDNQAIKKLCEEKQNIGLSSLIAEALVISYAFKKKKKPMLVVKNNLYNAQRLYERISTLLPKEECALFAVDESLRVEAIATSPEMIATRVETLSSLLKNPNQVIITSPSGYLRQLPSREIFEEGCIQLKIGMQVNMKELRHKLQNAGYNPVSHIDQPLSFASRGGIVDIYSINYEMPIRIEFFDDEIESIRFFDIVSQKTVEAVNEVEIVPASDFLLTEAQLEEIIDNANRRLEKENDTILSMNIENDLETLKTGVREVQYYPYLSLLSETASLIDYMDSPLVLLSNEAEIKESAKRLNEETIAYMQELVQEKKWLPRFTMWHEFDRIAKNCKKIKIDPTQERNAEIIEYPLPNETLAIKLKIINEEKRVLMCLDEKDIARVVNLCVEENIPYRLITKKEPIQEGISILAQDLGQGFVNTTTGLVVVSSNELLEIQRHAEVIHNYQELDSGDYVVHAQHGVGQYIGIETREVQGKQKDFLRVIYRGNAELLVPLEQFRLVRKFVSREGVVPRLNKLGSTEWEKTKKRIEESVTDIAERLMKLYSAREENIGHAYQKDSDIQKKFESEFEFTLTKDQEQAVQEVKKDMESAKPMDRLVCGDVGFGKTEIAVRAAFKAAAENKQVAVLCPTTILAEQHYKTFQKRFENYPFTIKVLDRLVPSKEVKNVLQDLKTGKIDVLIGTHRILSKDVIFKDLGLLVIDEEQRFGVEHKEKMKEFKNGVDVLTLSATPIPRTLQMSLVGIRQLSQLETAPENRFNVQTYVVEKNQGLIVDAIEKELARDGQVFYLYNNIDLIYQVARNLQHAIKDAKIGVIHGKMNREEIEDVMLKFNEKEINVLVCTTIIENGIDIPNANTMIIDNAQNFGLAQIYQIKGRVGRSNRVAYAYLLIPPQRQLSETAQKRLQAVKEFAKLGSGYKIAMRDLTIRGAGDLLGANQSGFIDTVGIDMYIEMLEEAIAKQKGEVIEKEEPLQHINISEENYIPKNFAPDDYDKITMYQDIDKIKTLEELSAYEEAVIDQFGRLPKEVANLFEKKHLEILVNEKEIDSYKERVNENEVVFAEDFSNQIDGVKLFEIFTKISKDIQLSYKNQKIIARVPKGKDYIKTTIQLIEQAKGAKRHEN